MLDTNILIDYPTQRKPFFANAGKLRIVTDFEDVGLGLCDQSLVSAEYILRKAVPMERPRAMLKRAASFCGAASVNRKDLDEYVIH